MVAEFKSDPNINTEMQTIFVHMYQHCQYNTKGEAVFVCLT